MNTINLTIPGGWRFKLGRKFTGAEIGLAECNAETDYMLIHFVGDQVLFIEWDDAITVLQEKFND